MLAMPAMQQKYTGGYTNPTVTNADKYVKNDGSNDSIGMSVELQLKMLEAFNKLNAHLDNGLYAKIGDKTIVEFNDRNDYLKNIVGDAN